MRAIIDAVVGILMILGVESAFGAFYKAIETETILKIQKGFPSLEKYTRKLTNTKLKY